jgi:hypothetical protein
MAKICAACEVGRCDHCSASVSAANAPCSHDCAGDAARLGVVPMTEPLGPELLDVAKAASDLAARAIATSKITGDAFNAVNALNGERESALIEFSNTLDPADCIQLSLIISEYSRRHRQILMDSIAALEARDG